MPEPMKEGLNSAAVRRIAKNLARAWPELASRAFVRDATRGLASLELKQRIEHVIESLKRHLPPDYPEALEVLVRAGKTWDAGDPNDPLRGFAAWPIIDFVGVHGVDHFDASLEALRRLTKLFSAEFAIRPFIEHDQKRAFRALTRWTRDPDEHVRRLVSEGTRPRLPWGRRLRELQSDPRPSLALLERLKDDSSDYVRRSVANHLNDIAKDHPDIVVETCRRWSKGADERRERLVRHALRTLVKKGDRGALAVLGHDQEAKVRVSKLRLSKKRIDLGGEVELSFDLRSTGKQAQSLVVDYAVHHVKKRGGRTPKVFKLKTIRLAPGEATSVKKLHRFKEITTRTYHSGAHRFEVLINGKPRTAADLHLRVPTRPKRPARGGRSRRS